MPAREPRAAACWGRGRPRRAGAVPKGGRTADILFPGKERRGPRDAEEEEKGGVEALPALEEEEEDVEGGSGRVEGLFEKWEDLHLP